MPRRPAEEPTWAMTAPELAQKMKVSAAHIYRLAQKHDEIAGVRVVRLGDSVRFHRGDAERLYGTASQEPRA